MRTLIVTGTILLAISSGGAVFGQTTPSPSEQQVQEINRSLQQQGRRLQQDEQNQFNLDQLQLNQNQRNEGRFSSPIPYRRGCPSGSAGC
jgi:hypothetical protein